MNTATPFTISNELDSMQLARMLNQRINNDIRVNMGNGRYLPVGGISYDTLTNLIIIAVDDEEPV